MGLSTADGYIACGSETNEVDYKIIYCQFVFLLQYVIVIQVQSFLQVDPLPTFLLNN